MTQREPSNAVHSSTRKSKKKGSKKHARNYPNTKDEKQSKKVNSRTNSNSSLLPGLSTFEENTKVWLNSRHSQVRYNEAFAEQTKPREDLTETPRTRNKTRTTKTKTEKLKKRHIKDQKAKAKRRRQEEKEATKKEESKTKKQQNQNLDLDNSNSTASFLEISNEEGKKNSRQNQKEKSKLLSSQRKLEYTTKSENGTFELQLHGEKSSFPKDENRTFFPSPLGIPSSSFIQSSSIGFNSPVESCEVLSRNSSLFLETTPYLCFLAQKAQNNQKILATKETVQAKEEINQRGGQMKFRFDPNALYFDTKKSVKDWCLRLVSELYSLRIREGETKEKADMLSVSAENQNHKLEVDNNTNIKTEESFDAKAQMTTLSKVGASSCPCHFDLCASSYSQFCATKSKSSYFFGKKESESSSSSSSSSFSSICLSTVSSSACKEEPQSFSMTSPKEQEREKTRNKEQQGLGISNGKSHSKQKVEKEANHKKEQYRHVLTPENFHFATLLRLLKSSAAYKNRRNVLALKDTRITHIGCRRREHENGSWAKNASFYIGLSDDTELFVTYTECLDNGIEGYLNRCYLTFGNQEPLHIVAATTECEEEEVFLHHANATQAWNYPTAFNHAVRCHFNKRKTNYFQELKKKEKNNSFYDLEKARVESIVKYQSFHTFESILHGFIEKFEYSPSFLETKIKIKGKSKCTIDDPLIAEQWQQYHDAVPLVLCVPIETWSEKLANKITLFSWQLDIENEDNDVLSSKNENFLSRFIPKSNSSEYSSYKIVRLPQIFQKVKEKRKAISVRSSSRLKKRVKNGQKGRDVSISPALQQESPNTNTNSKKVKKHSFFVKDHLSNTTKSSFLFSFFGFLVGECF